MQIDEFINIAIQKLNACTEYTFTVTLDEAREDNMVKFIVLAKYIRGTKKIGLMLTTECIEELNDADCLLESMIDEMVNTIDMSIRTNTNEYKGE